MTRREELIAAIKDASKIFFCMPYPGPITFEEKAYLFSPATESLYDAMQDCESEDAMLSLLTDEELEKVCENINKNRELCRAENYIIKFTLSPGSRIAYGTIEEC